MQKTYPYKYGNRFSVNGENGVIYVIIDIIYENLKELIARGTIDWPIKIKVMDVGGNDLALIKDKRVPENWLIPAPKTIVCNTNYKIKVKLV